MFWKFLYSIQKDKFRRTAGNAIEIQKWFGSATDRRSRQRRLRNQTTGTGRRWRNVDEWNADNQNRMGDRQSGQRYGAKHHQPFANNHFPAVRMGQSQSATGSQRSCQCGDVGQDRSKQIKLVWREFLTWKLIQLSSENESAGMEVRQNG